MAKFNLTVDVLETEEVEPAELSPEEHEVLVLELGTAVEHDGAESIGMLFKTVQVGTVELDERELVAIKFEETEIGGVEIDGAE